MYNAQWIHKIEKANDIIFPDYRDKPKLFLNILNIISWHNRVWWIIPDCYSMCEKGEM